MKTLNIVESAYRGTLEEQDDTILWLSHVMRGAGAELGVLLRGNAVNYAVRDQDASGLAFGDVPQTQPPLVDRQVLGLVDAGTPVHVVEDDLEERGIETTELLPGLKPISRRDVAKLFDDFDLVFHW